METTVRKLFKETPELQTEVIVKGWIRTIRNSKEFGFIELNDGTFFKNIQVVFEGGNLENFEEVSKLTIASSVVVKGILVKSKGSEQPVEINAISVEICNKAAEDFPLQKKRHTLEYLRTIAHLRPRANLFQAVFRVRSLAAFAIHKFFNEQGFIYVHTPIITGSDCEGAGEMFRVTTLNLNNIPLTPEGKVDFKQDFFSKETNLTVSGQLSVETFAHAYKNVYTFGPTFRAENSNTTKHISEFWMIEPEMAFADIQVNMDVAEKMVKFVIGYVIENAKEELEFLNQFVEKGLLDKLNHVYSSKFAKVDYTDAIKIMQKSDKKFDYEPKWGIDLQTEHERYLAEEYFKKPVFVINYPKDIKAFYMKLNQDGKTVAAMDMLVPGIGELIGGSQREEDYDKLLRRIEEMKLDVSDYDWYLDLRRFGSVVHSGYGLGFERMVMYLTGVSNIRDVIPFPRTPGHAEF